MNDNEVVNLIRFDLSTCKSALSIPAPLVFGVIGTFLRVGLIPVKQEVFGVFWSPLAREPSATERDIARDGDMGDTGQVGDRGLCSTWQRWEVSLHPVTAPQDALLEEQGAHAGGEAVVQRRSSHTVSPPGVILFWLRAQDFHIVSNGGVVLFLSRVWLPL